MSKAKMYGQQYKDTLRKLRDEASPIFNPESIEKLAKSAAAMHARNPNTANASAAQILANCFFKVQKTIHSPSPAHHDMNKENQFKPV